MKRPSQQHCQRTCFFPPLLWYITDSNLISITHFFPLSGLRRRGSASRPLQATEAREKPGSIQAIQEPFNVPHSLGTRQAPVPVGAHLGDLVEAFEEAPRSVRGEAGNQFPVRSVRDGCTWRYIKTVIIAVDI